MSRLAAWAIVAWALLCTVGVFVLLILAEVRSC